MYRGKLYVFRVFRIRFFIDRLMRNGIFLRCCRVRSFWELCGKEGRGFRVEVNVSFFRDRCSVLCGDLFF